MRKMDEERTPADAGGTTDSLSITARTPLWISWGRVAVKHEAMANAVRHEVGQPTADRSRLLEQEADAGLVGICAAAFALEALSRELAELGAISQTTLSAWKNKPPKAENRVLEVVSQTVDARSLVNMWRAELSWLFEVRGATVHYGGRSRLWRSTRLGCASRRRR